MSQYIFTACAKEEIYPFINDLIDISKSIKVPQEKMVNLLTSLDMEEDEALLYLDSKSAFSIVAFNILQTNKKSDINIVLYDAVILSKETDGYLVSVIEKHKVYNNGNVVETYWTMNYNFVGYQYLLFTQTLGMPLRGDIIKLNGLGTTLVVMGYDEEGKMMARPTQNDKNIFPGKEVYKDRSIGGLGWFVFSDTMRFNVISPISIDIGDCEITFEIFDHLPEECLNKDS